MCKIKTILHTPMRNDEEPSTPAKTLLIHFHMANSQLHAALAPQSKGLHSQWSFELVSSCLAVLITTSGPFLPLRLTPWGYQVEVCHHLLPNVLILRRAHIIMI